MQVVSVWARRGEVQNRKILKSFRNIKAVKELGLETCGTFGLLQDGMAEQLKEAGLDYYYNHTH